MTHEPICGTPRILLVDDHQLVLERVSGLLTPIFDVVGSAHSGREMILEAIRLDPDVIVTDISMPDVDGIEAAHQLRVTGSRAKLVFLTIHTDEEFVKACLAAGALGYVIKTHLKRDLIPAIRAALSDHSFISPKR